jgi:hypothetical protein
LRIKPSLMVANLVQLYVARIMPSAYAAIIHVSLRTCDERTLLCIEETNA